MSRVKSKSQPIVITRRMWQNGASGVVSPLPPFIPLVHRHLEKESTSPDVAAGTLVTFTAPLDLVRMTIPEFISKDIDSIDITYRRG